MQAKPKERIGLIIVDHIIPGSLALPKLAFTIRIGSSPEKNKDIFYPLPL